MKTIIYILLITELFLFSCVNHKKPLLSIDNNVRWHVYKSIYLLTERQKNNLRYTNQFVTTECYQTNAIQKQQELFIPNYLLLDLVFYPSTNKNDTISYYIDKKYNGYYVTPINAIEIPDCLVLFKDHIVDIKVGSLYLSPSYYDGNNDSLFNAYLQTHKNTLHPWLRQEAQRRGIIK